MAARLAELRVAAMFLTRLPVGRVSDPVPGLDQVRWAFPAIGLPIGLIAWAVFAAASGLGASVWIAAIVTLAALAMVTGALHHDGLADFADGIGGGRDRAHCLEIMRDSRIGSYGVLALVLLCALWIASVAELAPGLAAFLAVSVVSRWLMTMLLAWMPPARRDGLGAQAGASVQGALLPGLILSLLLCLWMGWPGLLALIAMAAAAGFLAWRAHRRIGGQTGDVLGATQVLSETVGWTVLAMAAA